jgi:hypothetical protein
MSWSNSETIEALITYLLSLSCWRAWSTSASVGSFLLIRLRGICQWGKKRTGIKCTTSRNYLFESLSHLIQWGMSFWGWRGQRGSQSLLRLADIPKFSFQSLRVSSYLHGLALLGCPECVQPCGLVTGNTSESFTKPQTKEQEAH